MSTYSFSDDAIADLEAIFQLMSATNRDFAIRFFEKVREKCRKVAQFPYMGKSYEEIKANLRGFVVDNYIIFYFPRTNGITVVRVINGYRDLQSLSI